MELVEIYEQLAQELEALCFSSPVAYVYNPLLYARNPHELYLQRFGRPPKEAVFLGMNPGPWGMAQTGVPFGEIRSVRDWLQINGLVGKPSAEHPKKKVEGFACRRSEVSGLRLWGLFQEKYGTPEPFFSRFFVLNYCPLLFLDGDGRNLTPDRLKKGEQEALASACNQALRRAVACLRPGLVIGVGAYAEAQAMAALEGFPVKIGRIMHPSPSNPQANRDWKGVVVKQLEEQGVVL